MTTGLHHHLPSTWDGCGPAAAVCGDWHGNIAYAEKVLWSLHARGITRVVHVGDFGFWFTPEFTAALDELLARYQLAEYKRGQGWYALESDASFEPDLPGTVFVGVPSPPDASQVRG